MGYSEKYFCNDEDKTVLTFIKKNQFHFKLDYSEIEVYNNYSAKSLKLRYSRKEFITNGYVKIEY